MNPKQRKLLTLAIVHQHPRVLLGLKKKGFGEGYWNGFGGKVEPGEDIEEAARREVVEEAGIEPTFIEKYGILEFEFESDPSKILEVHIFKIEDFTGDPVESDEMKPQWFMIEDIPFSNMWSDDVYWFPLILKGRKFKGRFLFDAPSSPTKAAKILDKKLEVVSHID